MTFNNFLSFVILSNFWYFTILHSSSSAIDSLLVLLYTIFNQNVSDHDPPQHPIFRYSKQIFFSPPSFFVSVLPSIHLFLYFSYVPCPLGTCVFMALYSILSIVSFSKFCLFTIFLCLVLSSIHPNSINTFLSVSSCFFYFPNILGG